MIIKGGMIAAAPMGDPNALEIASGRLRYLHDPVLDALVRQLGLMVTIEQVPFEPEAGAYGGHHHQG